MMTRFVRDNIKVRMDRDIMGEGYYIFTEGPGVGENSGQRIEHFPLHLYPFHCSLYEAHGYQRLRLCEACKGQGWRWVPSNHGEDAERDLCPECQGEGGYLYES